MAYAMYRLNLLSFLASSQITGNRCDILEEAVSRYYNMIFHPTRGKGVEKRFEKLFEQVRHGWEASELFRGYLDTLSIDLQKPCDIYPSFSMDESCKLTVFRLFLNTSIFCM